MRRQWPLGRLGLTITGTALSPVPHGPGRLNCCAFRDTVPAQDTDSPSPVISSLSALTANEVIEVTEQNAKTLFGIA